MPWARLDDRANGNQKLVALSDAAWRMWGCALIYAQDKLTDGFIPDFVIHTFGVRAKNKEAVADELCRVLVPGKGPLWHKVEGGYQVHDYLDWNDSRHEIEASRQQAKERKDRWRATRAERDTGTHPGTRSKTRQGTRPATQDPSGSRSTLHDPRSEVSTNQKLQTAPTRELLTRFDQRHQARFGAKAAIGGAKDAKRIADLWRQRQGDPVTVEQLIDAFFETRDPFVLQAGFGVGVFISQIPKLVPLVAADVALPVEPYDWWAECKRLHNLACGHEPAHWAVMQRANRQETQTDADHMATAR